MEGGPRRRNSFEFDANKQMMMVDDASSPPRRFSTGLPLPLPPPLSVKTNNTNTTTSTTRPTSYWPLLFALVVTFTVVCFGVLWIAAINSSSSNYHDGEAEQHSIPPMVQTAITQQGLRKAAACIPREYCAQPGVQCDLAKITLCPPSPTTTTTSSSEHYTLLPKDLLAWQAIYTALGGKQWLKCSANFDTPCECEGHVECEQHRIVAIRHLGNNNLKGPLPVKALLRLDELRWLDLNSTLTSETTGAAAIMINQIPARPCLALPRCRNEMVCDLPGYNMSSVRYCDEEQATTATSAAASTLAPQDLAAWRKFYADTHGESWTHCSQHELTPCECGQHAPDASSNKFVKCRPVAGEDGQQQLRITRIHLPNNNLRGGLFADLRAWTALRQFDLANTPSLVVAPSGNHKPSVNRLSGPCLVLPACDNSNLGAHCSFAMSGLELCSRISSSSRSISAERKLDSVATPVTHKQDAMAFAALRHQLSSPQGWAECDTSVDPCNDCGARVECELDVTTSYLRITKLDLTNNRLFGRLPERLPSFPQLRVLLLSNYDYVHEGGGWGDVNDRANELDYPAAAAASSSSPASCLDYALCKDSAHHRCEAKNTAVRFCSEMGELPGSELLAWTDFYDSMNGPQWKRCRNARDSPCAHAECVQCDKTANNDNGLTIVGITLSSNNLALTTGQLPVAMPLLPNLQRLDLSRNNKLDHVSVHQYGESASQGKCWSLPQRRRMTLCRIPIRVC